MRPLQIFVFAKCILAIRIIDFKFESFSDVVCLLRSFSLCCVLEVFEKYTNDLSRQRAHTAHRMPILGQNLPDFGQIFSENWSDSQSHIGQL